MSPHLAHTGIQKKRIPFIVYTFFAFYIKAAQKYTKKSGFYHFPGYAKTFFSEHKVYGLT
jgi:hypothetical protein